MGPKTSNGQTPDGVVEFEEDHEGPKPLGGRRKKQLQEKKRKMKAGSFETLGLSPPILRAVKRKGYRLPTPIQRRAMPHILQGLDVIGMARTGSGKTAAFVLPMLEKLKSHSHKAGARAVILAPTRELALQTMKVVRELGRYTDLRVAVLVGGDAMEAQFAELAQNPDVIVATPGRLLHHLAEVEGMSLQSVEYVVFDEADRLFEMGFADQIRELISKMSDTRQTLMFSATLPQSLAEFAQAKLQNPQIVRLNVERRISPDLSMAFFTVRAGDKLAALLHLVREVVSANQLTILFASTRHHVEFLYNLMEIEKIPAACVFGTMDQTARKIHVAKFRAQKVHLLVTTDVAARGIDIPLIDNVINYDFPAKPELFVHRVGRAARMGRTGTAYSLLTPDELPYLLDLHLYLSRPLKPAPLVHTPSGDEGNGLGEVNHGESLYGQYPQVFLDPVIEHVREVIESHTDLSSAQRSLTNAFQLYLRTRPGASSESVRRAKEMPKEGVHPLLLSATPAVKCINLEAEAALAVFTQSLKRFRPAATVLEADIAHVKPMTTGMVEPASRVTSRSNDVMNKMRSLCKEVIEKERKRKEHDVGGGEGGATQTTGTRGKRARLSDGARRIDDEDEEELGSEEEGNLPGTSEASDEETEETFHHGTARQEAVKVALLGGGVLNEGRFRDGSFYLGHNRDERTDKEELLLGEQWERELQNAVLDLTAEDQEGMRAQQRQYHWDKRKKRYVQIQGAEMSKGTKRIRTESGKSMEMEKMEKGLYKKWVKYNKQRVATRGEEDDVRVAQDLAKRFTKAGRHKSWKIKGALPVGKEGELKNLDQVKRERKVKDKKLQRLKEKQKGKSKSQRRDDGVKKRKGK